MELTYRVHGAFWSAAYDLHVAPGSADTPAQLDYYAQVTQRTGEDWENAAFVLSTSEPGRFVTVPQMDRHVSCPWRCVAQDSSPYFELLMAT
jgi:hypothetical protein